LRLTLLTFVIIPIFLWGCATSTVITGSDFNSSKVSRIQKGVTTTAQILYWLGEPYSKKPVSAVQTIWLYAWVRPTADPNVVPFGHRTIGTSGYKKTLCLFITNDIVVDYTYEEGVI